MVATPVSEDDQKPPEVILDKVVVEPAQILVAPEIGESVVDGFTVTVVVTGLLGHPLLKLV